MESNNLENREKIENPSKMRINQENRGNLRNLTKLRGTDN